MSNKTYLSSQYNDFISINVGVYSWIVDYSQSSIHFCPPHHHLIALSIIEDEIGKTSGIRHSRDPASWTWPWQGANDRGLAHDLLAPARTLSLSIVLACHLPRSTGSKQLTEATHRGMDHFNKINMSAYRPDSSSRDFSSGTCSPIVFLGSCCTGGTSKHLRSVALLCCPPSRWQSAWHTRLGIVWSLADPPPKPCGVGWLETVTVLYHPAYPALSTYRRICALGTTRSKVGLSNQTEKYWMHLHFVRHLEIHSCQTSAPERWTTM